MGPLSTLDGKTSFDANYRQQDIIWKGDCLNEKEVSGLRISLLIYFSPICLIVLGSWSPQHPLLFPFFNCLNVTFRTFLFLVFFSLLDSKNIHDYLCEVLLCFKKTNCWFFFTNFIKYLMAHLDWYKNSPWVFLFWKWLNWSTIWANSERHVLLLLPSLPISIH